MNRQNINRLFASNGLVLIFIAMLAFAVYANALGNQFTNWDDNSLIVNNENIKSLNLKAVIELFDYRSGGTYQPLRELSYALDFYFFKLNPKGYIFHSIVLHAMASMFLYLSLLIIIPKLKGGDNYVKDKSRFPALVATLLFVIHPIGCEAVVWLSGRKYVLLAFFSFSSLYFYARGTTGDNQNVFFLILSISCVILASLSSPFGVTLPVLFFAYDYSREASCNPIPMIKKNFFRYLPFGLIGAFILFFLLSKLVIFFVSDGSTGASIGHYSGDPLLTMWTMLRVLFDYVKNIILPMGLNNRYPDIIAMSAFRVKVIIILVGLCLLSYLIFKQAVKGNKVLFFCVAWFVILWLPASNIIPISTKMADRYIYTASPGFFLGFSFFLSWSAELQSKMSSMTVKLLVSAIVLASLICFTVQRNMVWKNSETLWMDSLKKDPNNFVAYNNLGAHLLLVNKNAQASLKYLGRALELAPEQEKSTVYKNYCPALYFSGKQDQAITCLKEHIQLNPYDYILYNSLGNYLFTMGKYQEAIKNYNIAIQIKSDYVDAFYNIAICYEAIGKMNDAKEKYEQILLIKPDHFNALNNLGNILMSFDRLEQAIIFFKKALKANNNIPVIYFNLGVAYKNTRQSDNAIYYFTELLKRTPEDEEAVLLLALEYIDIGQLDTAESYLRRALQIDPDYIQAKQLLKKIKRVN